MSFWEKFKKPKIEEKSLARRGYEKQYNGKSAEFHERAAKESLERWLYEVNGRIEAMQRVLDRPAGDKIWGGDKDFEEQSRKHSQFELEMAQYEKEDIESALRKKLEKNQ